GGGRGRVRPEGRIVHPRRTLLGPRLEAPEIGRQRAELGLHVERPTGIADCGDNLPAMANDSGVGQAAGDIVVAEPCHFGEIEAAESGAEVLQSAKDGQQGQDRMKALKADLLEKAMVVGSGASPLLIVIATIIVEIAVPEAAGQYVSAGDQAGLLHAGVP